MCEREREREESQRQKNENIFLAASRADYFPFEIGKRQFSPQSLAGLLGGWHHVFRSIPIIVFFFAFNFNLTLYLSIATNYNFIRLIICVHVTRAYDASNFVFSLSLQSTQCTHLLTNIWLVLIRFIWCPMSIIHQSSRDSCEVIIPHLNGPWTFPIW